MITFYSPPALILAYTSYIAYRQSKHQELLHPMTAALIPFIAVATLIPATPLGSQKQTTTSHFQVGCYSTYNT